MLILLYVFNLVTAKRKLNKNAESTWLLRAQPLIRAQFLNTFDVLITTTRALNAFFNIPLIHKVSETTGKQKQFATISTLYILEENKHLVNAFYVWGCVKKVCENKMKAFKRLKRLKRFMKNEYQISIKNMTAIISLFFFIRTKFDNKASGNS